MPISAVYLRHRRPVDYGVTPGSTTITRRGRELFRRFLNVAQGSLQGAHADGEYTFVYGGSAEPAFANGAMLLSSASGTIGTVINGVTLTTTHGTTDILDAALIAAVVNASTNALVQGFVTANNLSATLTLVSAVAGNTVDVCGYRFTAISGTVPPNPNISGASQGYFDISTSDTAAALALAAAINSQPGLNRYVSALSIAGVVYVMARQFAFASPTFSWPTGPGVPKNSLISNAATITASSATLITSVVVALNACIPGVQGNAITTAASGTGVSSAGSAARLLRGTGLNVVSISDGL